MEQKNFENMFFSSLKTALTNNVYVISRYKHADK